MSAQPSTAHGVFADPAPPPGPERTKGLAPLLAFFTLGGLLAVLTVVPGYAPYAIVFLVPAAIAGTMAVAARPAAAVIALFALTGFQGTLIAYTPIPGNVLVDLVLATLWLTVAWKAFVIGRGPVWLLPGLVALSVYMLISLVDAFFANPITDGFASLHLSVWLMASFVLLALAPWSNEVLWKIAKGALVIGALVGAYALLRTITGPTGPERELALRGKPGFLQLKTSGSTPSSGHLAAWCTAMLPLGLAMTLALRGRWQYVAALTAGLSLFSVLATEIRTGIVAALAASVLVFVLFAASKSFSTNKKTLRLAVAGVLACVLAVGAYATTIGNSDASAARFGRILDPSNDFAYDARVVRWDEAFKVMADHPLGQGLGTLGSVAVTKPVNPNLSKQLDSSYVKVGVEQGPWVLAFFIIALFLMLANLCWRSVTTPDRSSAALGIAGAGAMLGLIVSFYANTFIEEPQVLTGWLVVGLGTAQLSRPRRPDDDAGVAELV